MSNIPKKPSQGDLRRAQLSKVDEQIAMVSDDFLKRLEAFDERIAGTTLSDAEKELLEEVNVDIEAMNKIAMSKEGIGMIPKSQRLERMQELASEYLRLANKCAAKMEDVASGLDAADSLILPHGK